MKHREALVSEVKEEYSNLAAAETQQHFHMTTTKLTPEGYYETLLNAVMTEIDKGTFDNCRSGTEIVNKVATDKTVLSDWSSIH